MSTIVEITVPAEDFRLGRVLEDVDATQFELERMIPSKEELMPFLWIHDADYEAAEREIRADADTDDVELLNEIDDRALFRITWPGDIDGLIQPLLAHDATILSAIGTADRWDFQFRFEDEADVPGFREACRDHDVRLELNRIYSAADPDLGDPTNLTPAQREALLTALEGGYFAIPRTTNLVELGEELGVSDQAVSERLRRAQTKLFTAGLVANASSDTDPDAPFEG